MKKAFDDETVLDALPLEAAGNPGAWNAWRAYRKIAHHDTNPIISKLDNDQLLADYPKQQDDWSWEGVWEERVRTGMTASISEAALFGNSGVGDDIVRLR